MRLTATRLGLAARGATLRDQILGGASIATLAYIAAVEAADGQQLESSVLAPMVTFANWRIPLGGTCCLMAGARTLAGALVPMVGSSPVASNFVSGDYNRIRLLGNGSTKQIATGANFGSSSNNHHAAVWVASAPTFASTSIFIGNVTTAGGTALTALTTQAIRTRSQASGFDDTIGGAAGTGLKGVNRSGGASYNVRYNGATEPFTRASEAVATGEVYVFSINLTAYSNAGLSMYSLGPALTLDDLDTYAGQALASISAALA